MDTSGGHYPRWRFVLLLAFCQTISGLEWTTQPKSLNPILLGKSDLTLDCVATGAPADEIKYAWFYNDTLIDFAKEKQISIFPNHSLYISVATDLTLGKYYCQASVNSESIHSLDAEVREAFNSEPPELSPFLQSLNEGDTGNLFCLSGESSPAAIISWQANGKTISDST